jgi:hypothetical protein
MPKSHPSSVLDVERFTYVQKDNEITFPMQLISCWNSSRININHRNNILTVVTDNDDVIMHVATSLLVTTVVDCYAIVGLVPPRSSKLGLTNLKIEACSTISNMQVWGWLGRWCAHEWQCSILRWPELMVKAACMHVWAPCWALVWAVVFRRQTRWGEVRWGEVMCNCISLFKEKLL